MSFLSALILVWGAVATLPLFLSSSFLRKVGIAGLLIGGFAIPWIWGEAWSPLEKLGGVTLIPLVILKGIALLHQPAARLWGFSKLGLLLYLSAWPGLDPLPFERRTDPRALTYPFAGGLVRMLCGLTGFALLAAIQPWLPPVALGWAACLLGLLTVHLGYSDLLTSTLHLMGYPVRRLFDRPLASRRLGELWGRRWNVGFVEMNRELLVRPLSRLFGARGAIYGAFVVSGLLHELAIGFPTGRWTGGPTLYFLLQAGGVFLERRFRKPSGLRTMLWFLVPLPLLFPPAFHQAFLQPVPETLRAFAMTYSAKEWAGALLLWAGIGHFLLPIASLQIPKRLRWREELAQLSPFNRKLMWAYGITIFMTVTGFGILTLAVRPQMLQGDLAARGISMLIAGFWALRLGLDAFYYRSKDWPEGPGMRIGHALLNALFVSLLLSHVGALILVRPGGA